MKEDWQVIDKPLDHIQETDGLLNEDIQGTKRTEKSVQKDNKALSAERKAEIDKATLPKNGVMSWSEYADSGTTKSTKKTKK